ncbi:MAG TPA: hypothetical protein VGH14_05410 [Solirubrobacterales bacterium]|jgi:hypothetical protein
MIRSSRTDALARMQAVNPVSAEALREATGEAEMESAMRRAIAAGESPARPIPAGDRVAMEGGAGGGRRLAGIFSRHRVASLGFGLACAAVIAVLVVLGGGSVETVKDGGRPTYAAAAVKVAQANPRLLVTAPGWSIIHAHSFEVDSGILEYRYKHRAAYGIHGHGLHLSWYPARLYRSILSERREVSPGRERRGEGTVETHTTVLGHRAIIFHDHLRGGSDYSTVLPPQGRVFIELDARLDEREYATVLRSLRAVSVDRWLAAMPPEVVQPAARSAVIAGMLDGVPLPPGFKTEPLEAETHFTDRYQLGQAVAGAVACGWLESWSAATRSGDEDAARAAVEGMAGARQWSVLLQMVQEKGFEGDILPANGVGWPSNIVAAAREIAAGHLRRRPAVRTIYSEGAVVGVETPANAAPVSVLGCHVGG